MRFLLTVEDTFVIAGRDLVVAPSPDPQKVSSGDIVSGSTARVRLLRPDGTEHTAMMTFYLAHHNVEGRVNCWLEGVFKELGKDDVPVGTQVWLLDE